MDDNNYNDNLTALLKNRCVMEISMLEPAKYNPHHHTEDDEQILIDSITDFNYLDPIVVNTHDGKNVIVGGHLRLKALVKLGYERVEVVTVDLDDVLERKLNLLLNHRSKYDMELLAELITNLDSEGIDVHALGFDDKTIDQFLKSDLLDNLYAEDFDVDIDLGEPDTKEGEVYELGSHRLICGDSRENSVVDKLFSGECCQSCVTDPPYGVDVGGKNKFLNKISPAERIEKEIANDDIMDSEEYRNFSRSWLELIPFDEYNTFYSFINGKMVVELTEAMRELGMNDSEILVWVKNNHVLGRQDYLPKHEFIIYGWMNRHKFYGKQRETVFEFDKPLKSKLHPTMKPVELVAELIVDGSAEGDIIYDPFGGSGTTIIASDMTKRKCYMVEKDPRYCDIIRKRWDDYCRKKSQGAV